MASPVITAFLLFGVWGTCIIGQPVRFWYVELLFERSLWKKCAGANQTPSAMNPWNGQVWRCNDNSIKMHPRDWIFTYQHSISKLIIHIFRLATPLIFGVPSHLWPTYRPQIWMSGCIDSWSHHQPPRGTGKEASRKAGAFQQGAASWRRFEATGTQNCRLLMMGDPAVHNPPYDLDWKSQAMVNESGK